MNGSDEDFELMGDMPKEDPIIAKVNFSMNNIFINLIKIISASSFTRK